MEGHLNSKLGFVFNFGNTSTKIKTPRGKDQGNEFSKFAAKYQPNYSKFQMGQAKSRRKGIQNK